MDKYDVVNIISLEVTRQNGQVKISVSEKTSDDEKTIRHYEHKDVNTDHLQKLCDDVVNLLNRTNQHGRLDRHILKELKTTGYLLYDTLLTRRAKEKLATTSAQHLILSIDDGLVQIPWELLYDGNAFLCRRFNMGRVVSTGQIFSEPPIRRLKKPLHLLIIADPKSDLDASYHEGVSLRDGLEKDRSEMEVELRSSSVDVDFVKANIKDFDVVHYAGHADYDVVNPSNSGFLLEDGKLTAADVINMVGPKSLPSMVFSNSCKSGHTQNWKVDNHYENEIYGLANAFLLAGVQHYIGTFWDVQDDAGHYFSQDFYRELMAGSMVGEAIRTSRMRMIERYGEEAIIWASYMLYGDPTFRYITQKAADDGEHETAVNRPKEIIKESMALRGGAGIGSARGVEASKSPWILFAGLLVLTSLIVFIYGFQRHTNSPQPQHIRTVTKLEPPDAKQKRIDALVASLLKNYKSGRGADNRGNTAQSAAVPPTLVFMNVNSVGINPEEKGFILDKTIQILQGSNRLRLVERGILDKLLEELKLSSSDLADPSTALKVGNILSARLMLTGSIAKEQDTWDISLRMVETETTSIKGAIVESLNTTDKRLVAEKLAQQIIDKIKSAYPLQGKVVSIADNRVLIDIGANEGVAKGLKMDVLNELQGMQTKAAKIIITDVEENRAHAEITESKREIKAGDEVKELL